MSNKITNEEYLRKLYVYFNNFSEAQFTEFEDEIFTSKRSRKQRAELEFSRLKKELYKDGKMAVEFFDDILKVASLLKVADLSSELVNEAYKLIVKIQLYCGMRVRLYTAFPLLEEEEEKLRLMRMAGEYTDGPKFNRKV